VKGPFSSLTLKLPSRFELNDGETVSLKNEDLVKERTFCLRVSPKHVDDLASSLFRVGFKKPSLSFRMGEKYSLSKVLIFPWELHMRIYDNGCIFSHIEVQRKYIQHLLGYVLPSLEESFSIISKFQDVEINYELDKKLRKVLEYSVFKLNAPRFLLPWQPFFMLSAFLVGFNLTKRKIFKH
jgi:hypothetical protein